MLSRLLRQSPEKANGRKRNTEENDERKKGTEKEESGYNRRKDCHFKTSRIHHCTHVRMETPNELNVEGKGRLSFGGKFDWQIRRSITGSAESSLNNSIGSRLQQLASRADRDAKVKIDALQRHDRRRQVDEQQRSNFRKDG